MRSSRHSTVHRFARDHAEKKAHPQKHLTLILGIFFNGIVCFLAFAILWSTEFSPLSIVMQLLGIALGAVCLYRFLTRHIRQRAIIRQTSFPGEWKRILEQKVPFYQALSTTDQERFREEIYIFLREKRITGITTSVDDTIRFLVAASAIIPFFLISQMGMGRYPGNTDLSNILR